jgi:phosphoribosylaminoimidazole-succinocarboxamide synthase
MSGGRVGSHRAEDAAELAGAEVAPLLPGYSHIYSGKVRDLYAPVDPATGHARSGELLLVATDRISVFDFVLDTPVPDKGRVLTQLSLWWFEQLAGVVPHHVLSTDVPAAVEGRAVLVRRLRMVPVECVARAYLTGGGLTEYEAGGSVSGVRLPSGLIDGSALPTTVFTPSTKAPMGQHDEPIGYDVVSGLVGEAMAARLRDLTVAVLDRGNDLARERGILIADTKVEFGLDLPDSADWSEADPQGLVLADEVLTPDSSRFWPADLWSPGGRQPSYDKQYVRDWLTSPESGWSRSSGEPPPPLPDEIVERTRDRYVEAYERLTGRTFT